MGRNSGSNRKGGLPDGDFDGGDKGIKVPKDLAGLVTIQNPQVYKSVKQAISRFHSVLGVRQKEVKIGTLPSGVGGVHFTENGQSKLVVLSKKVFNGKGTTTGSVAGWAQGGYKSGHLTQTNKAVAHIPTHELAHATWNLHMTSPKHKAAGREIEKLYNGWIRDKKKSGYGKYASSNVSEFFAEVCTKAIHGKSDKYTTAVKKIIRKHQL